MVKIFSNLEDMFNEMVKINSSWIKISEYKMNKLPISCKYFLTILDSDNDLDTIKMFSYIKDETREIEYPFEKKNDIYEFFLFEFVAFLVFIQKSLILQMKMK